MMLLRNASHVGLKSEALDVKLILSQYLMWYFWLPFGLQRVDEVEGHGPLQECNNLPCSSHR